MHPPQALSIYVFGDFELDPVRRIVASRRSGEHLPITGRAFDALLYLLERRGRLVEKRELIEAVWPHVVVEEGNLAQTIHTLRRAMGEQPGEHRYIATVPGRGYRLVARVEIRADGLTPSAAAPIAPQLAAEAQAAPRRRRWFRSASALGAAGLALSIVGLWLLRGGDRPVDDAASRTPPSIAVLPFVDMSAEKNQEHFGDGLAEEILNLLARSDELRVIARTSSFSFKNRNADIGAIAQRLAVTHVLEGSVRKSGERMRITAQLIDGATSAHVWSETYDRDASDVFGVQTQIATAVADALHVTLRSAGPKRSETSSPEAYERYLHGRHLFNRRADGDLLLAKSQFERAVQADPGYARAWAALAGVYLVSRYEDVELPDANARALEASQRALTLSPDLAEANVRAAQYHWRIGDEQTAGEYASRALALDPGDPLVIGMTVTRALYEGRMEDAVDAQRRMAATDPLSAVNRANLGTFLLMTDRLAEARIEIERGLELSPASESMTDDIVYVLLAEGRIDEALEAIQRLPAGYRRDRCLAVAYLARGEASEGEAALARLIARGEAAGADWEAAQVVAEAYAYTGSADEAFKWLAVSARRIRSEGMPEQEWLLRQSLRTAPFLKPLHADPRWDSLFASPGGG